MRAFRILETSGSSSPAACCSSHVEVSEIDSRDNRSLVWLGGGLFAVALLLTILTAPGFGIVSDEGNYFRSSLLQLGWAEDFFGALLHGRPFSVLNRDSVFEAWRWFLDRIPHPPLSRELSGLGYVVFRGILSPLAAYRAAIILTYSLLVAGIGVTTAWGSRSRLAGLAAGSAALTIPALFAYGHFANTDLFLAAFWFGTAASTYMYTETDRKGWLVASGLLLGAACATKFTGVLLLPVVLFWLVLRGRRDGKLLYIVVGLALLVFVVTNPVMWVAPIQGTWDYFKAGAFRSISIHVATLYFGEIYSFRGPWHFPFVWTAIVIPIPWLVAMGAGLTDRGNHHLLKLVGLNLGVLYGVTLLPATPLHDGIRLFLAVFPFLCVLAGLGVHRLGQLLREHGPGWLDRRPRVLDAVLLVGFLALPAVRTIQYHPHQLSYFNALIGGVRGASDRGLEITTQKELLNREVLADLRDVLPDSTVVDPGFMHEELCFYQAVGSVPPGWTLESTLIDDEDTRYYFACERPPSFQWEIIDRPAAEPQYLIVYNRQTTVQYLPMYRVDRNRSPVYELSVEGVPLMQVYRTR